MKNKLVNNELNYLQIYNNKLDIKKRVKILKDYLIKNYSKGLQNNIDVKCKMYLEILEETDKEKKEKFNQLKEKISKYIDKYKYNKKLFSLLVGYTDYYNQGIYSNKDIPLFNLIDDLFNNKIFDLVFNVSNDKITNYKLLKSIIKYNSLRFAFRHFEILLALIECNEIELLNLLQDKEKALNKLKKFDKTKYPNQDKLFKDALELYKNNTEKLSCVQCMRNVNKLKRYIPKEIFEDNEKYFEDRFTEYRKKHLSE